MSEPVVSVIVPVRNGRAHLPGLVASLEAQTLPRESFEVIVADDGSTDGSTEGLATADGWIRVTPGQPQNSYAARRTAPQGAARAGAGARLLRRRLPARAGLRARGGPRGARGNRGVRG